MSEVKHEYDLQPGQPIIEFKDVTKRYKLYKSSKQRLAALFFKNIKVTTKDAVNGVSFQVMPGEAVALVGRNGAGKSTILKMITGVCFPTTGTIEVRGRVSALLELTAGFEAEMTGRENIYLRGTTLGLSKEEIDEIMDDIIEFADIGEYLDQPVRSYSSGMRARLGFAINSNVNPEILIVDEALSVGDTNFRQKCLAQVRELIANENTTLLLVTHSAKTAKDFCQRGIYLKNGQIVNDGPIEETVGMYEEDVKKIRAKQKKKKAEMEAMVEETARQIEEDKRKNAAPEGPVAEAPEEPFVSMEDSANDAADVPTTEGDVDA